MRSTRRLNGQDADEKRKECPSIQREKSGSKVSKIPEKDTKKKVTKMKIEKQAVQKVEATKMKEDSGKKPVNKRSSLRSGSQPNMVYDFHDDSHTVKNEGKQKNMKKKTEKTKEAEVKNKPAVERKTTKAVLEKKCSFLTPDVIHKGNRRNGVKKKMELLPPPNFDDVSPIVRSSIKKRPNKSVKPEGMIHQNRRTSRSSAKAQSSLDSASVSFNGTENSFNDSAIFLSPRKKLTRFSSGSKKTSTPAIAPPKKSIKDTKTKQIKPSKGKLIKNTSTPCEVKTKTVFTKLKPKEPEPSPVQRSDTPTSDYASMDSIVEPSPSPEKPIKRKKGSPAFCLEDDYGDAEPLGLNRSINTNYSNPKRKKKLKTNRYSIEKVDQWASKVNSELEDVENFELSIEG